MKKESGHHTPETLREVCQSIGLISARLETIAKGMEDLNLGSLEIFQQPSLIAGMAKLEKFTGEAKLAIDREKSRLGKFGSPPDSNRDARTGKKKS